MNSNRKITNSDLLLSLVKDVNSMFEDVLKRRRDTKQLCNHVQGQFLDIFKQNIDSIFSSVIFSIFEGLEIFTVLSLASSINQTDIDKLMKKLNLNRKSQEAKLKVNVHRFFSIDSILNNLEKKSDMRLVKVINDIQMKFNRIRIELLNKDQSQRQERRNSLNKTKETLLR